MKSPDPSPRSARVYFRLLDVQFRAVRTSATKAIRSTEERKRLELGSRIQCGRNVGPALGWQFLRSRQAISFHLIAEAATPASAIFFLRAVCVAARFRDSRYMKLQLEAHDGSSRNSERRADARWQFQGGLAVFLRLNLVARRLRSYRRQVWTESR